MRSSAMARPATMTSWWAPTACAPGSAPWCSGAPRRGSWDRRAGASWWTALPGSRRGRCGLGTAWPSSRSRWAVTGSTATPTSTPRPRPTPPAATRPSWPGNTASSPSRSLRLSERAWPPRIRRTSHRSRRSPTGHGCAAGSCWSATPPTRCHPTWRRAPGWRWRTPWSSPTPSPQASRSKSSRRDAGPASGSSRRRHTAATARGT